MLGTLRFLQIPALILYPLFAYLAVRWQAPWLFIFAMGCLMVSLSSRAALRRHPVCYSSFLGFLLAAVLFSFWHQSFLLLYFPPIFMSLSMLILFASSLLPAQEPWITRLANLLYGELSPEVQQYTRKVTLLWCVFFAGMLVETIALSLFAPPALWSLFCNILNYGFIAIFFLLEYAYRRFHFRNHAIRPPQWRNLFDGSKKALPLLAHPSFSSVYASMSGHDISVAEFLSAVARLSHQLPAKTHVINLCENRYYFSVLFAAALLKNKVTLLPHQDTVQAIRALEQAFPSSVVIREQDFQNLLQAVPTPKAKIRKIPKIPQNQIAVILYTSGSTGQPTPWVKYWGQLVDHAHNTAAALNLMPHEPLHIIATVAPQHMYGLEHSVLLPWCLGYVLRAERPFFVEDIRASLAALPEYTVLFSTPLHLKSCIQSDLAFPRIRLLVSATATLSQTLAHAAEARFHAPLQEIYGCTEAGCIATRRTALTETWHLMSGYSLKIQEGQAYLLMPEKIRLEDELTLLDQDHFLLKGRLAENINIAGKRVSLSELNLRLNNIPGVEDGVFYLPSQEQENTRLAAFVVAPSLSEITLKQALRQFLDPAFLPRPLIFLKALPRSASGKIQKADLEAYLCPTSFMIAHDHPSLPGHFPGHPVVPGVLILEKVFTLFEKGHPDFKIGGCTKVKFLKPLGLDMLSTIIFTAQTANRSQFSVLQDQLIIATGCLIKTGDA